MAAIKFINYVIDKSYYNVNDAFEYSNDKLDMPVSFDAEVGIDKLQEKAYVIINLNLGDLEDTDNTKVPFTCNVSIRGIFSYEAKDYNTDSSLKNILGINAIAILYPYLRSYVSTITSLGNQFPAYTLPVMNFAETIQKNGLITFVGFDD
ncbi:protein-export chaperone SecB [Streptococcus hyointestinalis]|uniref:protein-export chaperone SecB n=1 Tax=Streptococcus hyointestinalis TaxID=1337 RepID=UPI003D0940CE